MLSGSEIHLEGSKAVVTLKTKNSHFMYSSQFDSIVSRLLSNLYGEDYKVEYRESAEEIDSRKSLEEIQKREIQEKMAEVEHALQEPVGNVAPVVPSPKNASERRRRRRHPITFNRR